MIACFEARRTAALKTVFLLKTNTTSSSGFCRLRLLAIRLALTGALRLTLMQVPEASGLVAGDTSENGSTVAAANNSAAAAAAPADEEGARSIDFTLDDKTGLFQVPIDQSHVSCVLLVSWCALLEVAVFAFGDGGNCVLCLFAAFVCALATVLLSYVLFGGVLQFISSREGCW